VLSAGERHARLGVAAAVGKVERALRRELDDGHVVAAVELVDGAADVDAAVCAEGQGPGRVDVGDVDHQAAVVVRAGAVRVERLVERSVRQQAHDGEVVGFLACGRLVQVGRSDCDDLAVRLKRHRERLLVGGDARAGVEGNVDFPVGAESLVGLAAGQIAHDAERVGGEAVAPPDDDDLAVRLDRHVAGAVVVEDVLRVPPVVAERWVEVARSCARRGGGGDQNGDGDCDRAADHVIDAKPSERRGATFNTTLRRNGQTPANSAEYLARRTRPGSRGERHEPARARVRSRLRVAR
jgi:hypothetical protein